MSNVKRCDGCYVTTQMVFLWSLSQWSEDGPVTPLDFCSLRCLSKWADQHADEYRHKEENVR